MTTKKSVFETLSAINVNEHIKKKGGLSYLSWPFAWGTLQEYYPLSSYEFIDPVFYSDGTCEVKVNVTVEEVTRSITLPVMDHRNNAIPNPTSRHISDSRMRCLVKCIAIFGLGLYIFAGEDIPQEETRENLAQAEKEAQEKEKQQADVLSEMIALIEADDIASTVLWHESNREEQGIYWKAINTKQKKVAREMLNSDEGKQAA